VAARGSTTTGTAFLLAAATGRRSPATTTWASACCLSHSLFGLLFRFYPLSYGARGGGKKIKNLRAERGKFRFFYHCQAYLIRLWRKNFFFKQIKMTHLKFFTIPILQVSDYNDELNAFLRTHKIISVEKQLIQSANNAYWCLAVQYVATSFLQNSEQTAKEKIDYRTVLDAESFARFSKLREVRKVIASEHSVSTFVVFTDAELAELIKLNPLSVAKMKLIKGIGDKKAEKYGPKLIELVGDLFNGTENGIVE
jgi:DNA uptake protein ComE-like DNA-binding protein